MTPRRKLAVLLVAVVVAGVVAIVAQVMAALGGYGWMLALTPASLYGIGAAWWGWHRYGRTLPDG